MSEFNQHELLTLDEMAAELRIARSSVYRLISKGELPKLFKIGKQNFIRRATLEKFLRAKEAEAMAIAA